MPLSLGGEYAKRVTQPARRSGGRWRILPPLSPGVLCRTINAHIGMSLAQQVMGMQTTHHALVAIQQVLARGIQRLEAAVDGKRVGDIANAIQTYCETRNYSVVRELVGHGCGRNMHEEPEVPNYGRRGCGPLLRSGMCICIEPMINLGSKNVVFENDGWTVRTKDRKPAAHFEHCIAIRPDGPDILSSFKFIEEVLGDNAI